MLFLFLFLSFFSFSFCRRLKICFFGASISLRFLFTFLFKKIQFFRPVSAGRPFEASFPFLSFLFPTFSCSSFLSFSFFHVFLFLFFSFLAFVSVFGSRCTMEMWCPHDIGRDSWDWVGPLLGREHASTPQSGVEAPRLSKRSLSADCIIVVVLDACLDVRCVSSQRHGDATTVTVTN